MELFGIQLLSRRSQPLNFGSPDIMPSLTRRHTLDQTECVRVLFVEDDPAEAQRLAALITRISPSSVVWHAATIGQALNVALGTEIHVVLVSWRFGSAPWIEACRSLETTGAKVIALIGDREVVEPKQAITARISGAYYEDQLAENLFCRLAQRRADNLKASSATDHLPAPRTADSMRLCDCLRTSMSMAI